MRRPLTVTNRSAGCADAELLKKRRRRRRVTGHAHEPQRRRGTEFFFLCVSVTLWFVTLSYRERLSADQKSCCSVSFTVRGVITDVGRFQADRPVVTPGMNVDEFPSTVSGFSMLNMSTDSVERMRP